jgi:hypothetical protein
VLQLCSRGPYVQRMWKNLGIRKGICRQLKQECRANLRVELNPELGQWIPVGSKNGTTTECVSMQSEISNGKHVTAPCGYQRRFKPAKAL